MHADGAAEAAFAEGSTVVRRDMLRGKVWTASPYRVIRDTGVQLTDSLIESRQGPFVEDWSSWRRAPTRPTPVLPVGMP